MNVLLEFGKVVLRMAFARTISRWLTTKFETFGRWIQRRIKGETLQPC